MLNGDAFYNIFNWPNLEDLRILFFPLKFNSWETHKAYSFLKIIIIKKKKFKGGKLKNLGGLFLAYQVHGKLDVSARKAASVLSSCLSTTWKPCGKLDISARKAAGVLSSSPAFPPYVNRMCCVHMEEIKGGNA